MGAECLSVVALQGENGPVGLFLKAPFPEVFDNRSVNKDKRDMKLKEMLLLPHNVRPMLKSQ
ncbi:hypothetical protein PRBEI_2001354300 [Prionailurus iriomotensis]